MVDELVRKLVRRHPHVFPDGTLKSRRQDEGQVQKAQLSQNWEVFKQEERSKKGFNGVFDDIPKVLPALIRAQKIQKRASKQKFDWNSVPPIYDKIQEEIIELKQAVKSNSSIDIEEEVGDLLFSCVNLARHLKVDSETALRRSVQKFTQRYLAMQEEFEKTDSVKSFDELSPEQMDQFWRQAKALSQSDTSHSDS